MAEYWSAAWISEIQLRERITTLSVHTGESIVIHRILADNTYKRSVASRLRRKRFQLFVDLLNNISPIVNVLDVGGSQRFWEMMADGLSFLGDVQVTLLNITYQETSLPNFKSIIGDARSMPQYTDKEFDIVFSNSTIEHVGNFLDQKNMANEVARVGKRYFIQTPSRFFPIEPHFVFPFFQFLPINIRIWLVNNFKLGWYPKLPDRERALSAVQSIRLISKSEFHSLFPDAEIYEEKYLGLTKSFIAYTHEK